MAGPSNKLPRGVVLDRGRYRAKIHVEGKQTWLGTFDTPEEASAAYQQAKAPVLEARRAGRPARQQRPPETRKDHKADIREQAQNWRGEYRGQPEPRQWEVEGETYGNSFRLDRSPLTSIQVYMFQGKTFRPFRGKMWALWRWSSNCVHPGCGERFEVMTPGSLAGMGVPSAFCAAHRRPGRPRRAITQQDTPPKAVQGPEIGPGGDPDRGPKVTAALLGIDDLV